jgi:phosphatidylglycerophosphate synthase
VNWLEEYRKSLKMKEVEEIPDLLFYRPVAFLLVRVIYRTEITPNQISLIAIVMGIFAGYFYSLGQPLYFTVGALFFLAFNILDCSDGQLARLKKNGTPVGRIIDGISDYIATVAVYLGILFGFSLRSDDHFYWVTMLALAGISNIIHGIFVDFYRTRFIDYLRGRSTFDNDIEVFEKEYESFKGQKGKFFERMVLLIYFRYSSLQRLLVARKKKTKSFITTPDEYFRKNRYIIRLWLLMGPTAQVTTIVICSLFNRFDIFIWILVAGFNSLALILWIAQKIIDSTFKKES